jgi:hypothetical protein
MSLPPADFGKAAAQVDEVGDLFAGRRQVWCELEREEGKLNTPSLSRVSEGRTSSSSGTCQMCHGSRRSTASSKPVKRVWSA